jgi:tetratricopeptide (TPR) repeat protein
VTIDDPTAIPETAEAVAEYLQEADEAFGREDNDRARPLYYAAVQSDLISDADDSRASHRLALILLAAGETEEAYRFAHASREPGRDDILRALDGATPDAPVDPSEVPQTFEAASRYWDAAKAARDNSDSSTEEALLRAISSSPGLTPGAIATASLRVAELAHADGRDDEGRAWAESALANASSGETHDGAVALLREMGVHVEDSNPIETAGSRRLIAGIEAWERGEQATARTEFQAVLDADDVTDADKGRAAFYLGSMAYYANDYDTARTHLHRARDNADDPEKTWATEMLEWRWQEEGS